MKEILFSVIIPVLNEEKYISKALLSLNNQDRKNFNVIIVDNNSTDNTVNVINGLKSTLDFNLQIIKCKPKGISYARNTGAKYAQKEYVVFIDADGKVHSEYFKTAGKLIQEYPNINVFSGMYFFSVSSVFKFLLYNSYLIPQYLGLFLYKLILGKVSLIGNNMVIKKGIFNQLGGFPHLIMEDSYFSKKYMKIYNAGKTAKINQPLYITYSPRRFEQKGYFNSLKEWIITMKVKVKDKYYETYR